MYRRQERSEICGWHGEWRVVAGERKRREEKRREETRRENTKL
jgi:hypothetical protein